MLVFGLVQNILVHYKTILTRPKSKYIWTYRTTTRHKFQTCHACQFSPNFGRKHRPARTLSNSPIIHWFLCKGNTPLITAAEYGHAPIVEYLIENNANLNAQNTDGKKLQIFFIFLLKSCLFFIFNFRTYTSNHCHGKWT